jgi:galactokinase
MVSDAFVAIFGRTPDAVADAPGRVNLIGEHTDYNGGLVLPTAIPQRAAAAVGRRDDETVRAASMQFGSGMERYRLGEERPGRGWLDYVQGLTYGLGRGIGGFDLVVDSEVPIGAGLASSAALAIAILRALRRTFHLPLDDVAMARLAQRAENEFVGARVGLMDQMAASLADERSALFLDTRSLAWRCIPLPTAFEVVVIDSGVPHAHAAGEYNRRRAECEEAARRLGVVCLRELTPGDAARVDRLPEPLVGRVRHVMRENARVEAAVEALVREESATLGALLQASHASLRDDYAVSTPELDRIVALACTDPDVHGARLTGGGFGGSIVVIARAGRGRCAGERIAARVAGARVVVPPVNALERKT